MLLHLITLCTGLIVAFGLHQIVELFRRRNRMHKERAARSARSRGEEATERTPGSASSASGVGYDNSNSGPPVVH